MKGIIKYVVQLEAQELGIEIITEETGNKEGSGLPEFRASVTIISPELFSEYPSATLDMVMATGMKHVMEIMQWTEMWEVELTNFDLGKEEGTGEDGMSNLQLGLMFNGLNPQGEA